MPRARSSSQATAAVRGMHQKHPAGRQTAAQLKAERANLVLARAAQKQSRAQLQNNLLQASSAPLVATQTIVAATPSAKAATKAGQKTARSIAHQTAFRNKGARTALGVREARGHLSIPRKPSLKKRAPGFKVPSHRITGIFRRVPKAIAPSGYLTATSWHQSRRAHHHPHALAARRRRRPAIKTWRNRRRTYRPR